MKVVIDTNLLVAHMFNKESASSQLISMAEQDVIRYMWDERMKIANVSEDPDDDKFLACAVAAQAEMIISHDEHLLSLIRFQHIPVHPASQALSILNTRLSKKLDALKRGQRLDHESA